MSNGDGGGCGCYMIIVAVNITIGALCFDYALETILGKNIPWYGDVICGLFLGEFAIPAAVICWVMTLCGVEPPFIP